MRKIKRRNKKNSLTRAKRVIVAMSGGVDSSVAAALLKKQGYNVAGVFMRFWSEDGKLGTGRNTCCSQGAEMAARAVAAKLGIPFYVLNLQKEFKKTVVDYFLKETARGRTPNPCIVCNKKIKFGLLFEKALGMGADFMATGHYARINSRKFKVQSSKFKVTVKNSKLFKLFRAKDRDKDQSYFLYSLTQKHLAKIFFPIGDYAKGEVYQMAKKWNLPFKQEESFDLCFVGRDKDNFLRKYLKQKDGRIMDLSGRILGHHQGLAGYTIGQRKRIELSQGPWWVVKKDGKKNILYVSNNEKDLDGYRLTTGPVNWISGEKLKLPKKVLAKIRYKSEPAPATVKTAMRERPRRGKAARAYAKADTDKRGNDQAVELIFKKPQRALTPGQSAVFYEKEELIGGGVIESAGKV